MLLRSLLVTLLSIPATTAILGVLLALVSPNESLMVSLLLLAFPVWVLVACAAYTVRRPSTSALELLVTSGVGVGVVAVLKRVGGSVL